MKLRSATAQVAHGGNLQQALAQYGGEAHEWLDLSSAVSPWSWYDGRGCTAERVLHLPQQDDALTAAVRAYYGQDALVVAGSQAAIRALPLCFERGDVWLLAGTYGEHAQAWAEAGHCITELSAMAIRQRLAGGNMAPDMLVLVNPGNPGGEVFTASECRQWAQQLAADGGWLLVDEAFMDLTPALSLLQEPLPPNLIVLRSPGKFFGLAGLRCGFVFAAPGVKQTLSAQLGPWTVSGPARDWVAQALSDNDWIEQQQLRVQQAHAAQAAFLPAALIRASTGLFFTLQPQDAALWQHTLAQHKIWTRLFRAQNLLRIGLVAGDAGRVRLAAALQPLIGKTG